MNTSMFAMVHLTLVRFYIGFGAFVLTLLSIAFHRIRQQDARRAVILVIRSSQRIGEYHLRDMLRDCYQVRFVTQHGFRRFMDRCAQERLVRAYRIIHERCKYTHVHYFYESVPN